MKQEYLRWVVENTVTTWWHDSVESSELALGIERGAVGATSNPFLSHVALSRNRQAWSREIDGVLTRGLVPEEQAEALMCIAV